jgi:hypothetical protein
MKCTTVYDISLDDADYGQALAEAERVLDEQISLAWSRDLVFYRKEGRKRGEGWIQQMVEHRRAQLKLWREVELQKMLEFLRQEFDYPVVH